MGLPSPAQAMHAPTHPPTTPMHRSLAPPPPSSPCLPRTADPLQVVQPAQKLPGRKVPAAAARRGAALGGRQQPQPRATYGHGHAARRAGRAVARLARRPRAAAAAQPAAAQPAAAAALAAAAGREPVRGPSWGAALQGVTHGWSWRAAALRVTA